MSLWNLMAVFIVAVATLLAWRLLGFVGGALTLGYLILSYHEPDAPLIYLAAKDPSDRRDVVDDLLREAFVQRWSPGVWQSVSAPHWMEAADPNLVVKNLERVIARAN